MWRNIVKDSSKLEGLGAPRTKLLSSSRANLQEMLNQAFSRLCPFSLPSYSIKTENVVGEDWDYSTDLPNQVVELFRNYEGFRNKCSPAMVHDELTSILTPSAWIAEVKYLGTATYLRMTPEYWRTLQNLPSQVKDSEGTSSTVPLENYLFMLGPSLRSLFLAQVVQGCGLSQVQNLPSYFDLTPLTRISTIALSQLRAGLSSDELKGNNSEEAIRMILELTMRKNSKEPFDVNTEATDFSSEQTRSVTLVSSFDHERLARTLTESFKDRRIYSLDNFLVGPTSFIKSASSNKQLELAQVLDSGVNMEDIRLLALHSKPIFLPLCLSLEDLKSDRLFEIREFKESTSAKLQKSTKPGAWNNGAVGGDDWKLWRVCLKSQEWVLQSQDQSDISSQLSDSSVGRRKGSLPLESAKSFYDNLEWLLSSRNDFSGAAVGHTVQLIKEVF